MLRALLFAGLALCAATSSANVLYFTKDMTERLYLLDNLFQPSNRPLEGDTTTTRSQTAVKQRKGIKLFQPPQSLLEELISQNASFQSARGIEDEQSGSEVELVVEEETLDPFFNIGFGKVDTEITGEAIIASANSDVVSGIGARELLENQLSRNRIVKQAALDLRSFYRETDFSSVNVKFGDYNDSFSISSPGGNTRSQSVLRSLEPKKRKNKDVVEDESSRRFGNFIPSFLFSGTFWLVSYLLLCVAIFARSMLRRR